MTFNTGDLVEGTCMDGRPFRGVLMDFTDHYIVVNGYGYPLDMVKELSRAT